MILTLYLAATVQCSLAAFISWEWKGSNLSKDEIFIRKELLRIPGREKYFGQRIRKLSNITNLPLDERCQRGLPMSISLHIQEPYAGFHQMQIKKSLGFIVFGIFPAIIQTMVRFCCHINSSVIIAKLRRSAREAEEEFEDHMYDFTMPLYGNSWKTTIYRGNPFIPVVEAPYVMLMVYDGHEKTKTGVLAKTLLRAWPMLVFIILAAITAGFVVWACEQRKNSEDFPPSMFRGVWEGFWWAFVTMTTVGYGDRYPLSIPGRIFCILWVIFGIIMISVFTGLITASITADTQPYFNIHGAKIGAVNGSEEFKLGVQLHANMIAYALASHMTSDLQNQKIDGALVDNFAITRFSELMKEEPIRIERIIAHPITYGLVLPPHGNQTEKCFRRYLNNYRHDAFEKIAQFLKPFKNPTDGVNKQVKTVESYFHQEENFDVFLKSGLILVGSIITLGLLWELCTWIYHRGKMTPKDRNMNVTLEMHDGFLSSTLDQRIDARNRNSEKDTKIRRELCKEYKLFQSGWIKQLDDLQPSNGKRNRKRRK